jgi:uncharacterized protein DUF5320
MPRGDKTGPGGQGAMTGRGMGTCTGNNQAGFFNFRTFGRGLANGFRGGRGRNQGSYQNGFGGRMMNSQSSSDEMIENEIDALKKRLSYLESELKSKN